MDGEKEFVMEDLKEMRIELRARREDLSAMRMSLEEITARVKEGRMLVN